MSRPYSSRMGRAALEDGPAEPRLVPCPDCNGHGVLPAGKFAPRNERPCDFPGCDEGLVDAAELDDEP